MIAGKFPIAILIVAALAGVSCEAADQKQIQQLLETKSCEGCDLSEADLHGQNLFEAKLAGANLRDADLRDATLTSADLSGARLAGAKLEGAKLIEAKLNAIKDKDGKSQGGGLEYEHL